MKPYDTLRNPMKPYETLYNPIKPYDICNPMEIIESV